jgi:hypothetical protein
MHSSLAVDRRRLPQPTVEDMPMPTSAIGLNNRLSGFSIQQQQQQLMSGGSPKRNQLPSLPAGFINYGSNAASSGHAIATIPIAGSAHIVHQIEQPISLAGSRIATSGSSTFTSTAAMVNHCITSRAMDTRRPFSPVSFGALFKVSTFWV